MVRSKRRLVASEHPLVQRQRLFEAADTLEKNSKVVDGVQRVGVGRAVLLEAARWLGANAEWS